MTESPVETQNETNCTSKSPTPSGWHVCGGQRACTAGETQQGPHGTLTFWLYLLTVWRDDDAFQLSELQMFEDFPQPQYKSAFGLSLNWIFLVHTILETNQLFQQVRNTGVNFFTEHLAAVAERNIRHGHLSSGCDTLACCSWHTSNEVWANHALMSNASQKGRIPDWQNLKDMDGGILPTPNHKGQRLLGSTSPGQTLLGTSPRG